MLVRNHSVSTAATRFGFSLLEFLVVIIILATLAAIVFPAILGSDEDAKIAVAQSIVKTVQKQVDIVHKTTGKIPGNIQREWFVGNILPKNPLVPEHPRSITDDVDGSNNPNKWHPTDKTTSSFPFWYNAHNGAFRIRVPEQASGEQTLALYNRVNMTDARRLNDTRM